MSAESPRKNIDPLCCDRELIAQQLVDRAIDRASETVSLKTGLPVERENAKPVCAFGNATWPRIQDFTVELGKDKIEDYCFTWNLSGGWLFCVDFLSVDEGGCCSTYLYEVKYSIPTLGYPIPQAVASVFFSIAVSKIPPSSCRVKVTYVLEGFRFVFTPGKIKFQEQWLYKIIDAKIKYFKTLRF